MSFSFVQSIDIYDTTNLTLNGVGAGNLLVGFVCAASTLASVNISGGGTWVPQTELSTGNSRVKLYYCLSATGGNSTFSLSGSMTDGGWGVLEFSNSGTAVFDSLTNTRPPSGTTFSSGNITVGNNNSLMVSCLSDETVYNQEITWNSEWVKQEESISHLHSCAYRIIVSSGTYTASGSRLSSSNDMALSTLVFYESGAAATASLPIRPIQFYHLLAR